MKKLLNYIKVFVGDFGCKLQQNIQFENPSHFILDKHRNCPFLNNEKLCEIYINLGEKSLCKICAEHPRYYEWFNEVKECGIGLCCEEAARIILSQREPFKTYEIEIPIEETNEYDEQVYAYLRKAREKIISYLDNSDIPFNNRICNVLWYSNVIQQNLDSELLDDEDIIDVHTTVKPQIQEILKIFLTLEYNKMEWKNYIEHCINVYANCSEERVRKFNSPNSQIDDYLKNVAIYFIWRYFLKGTFDFEILSKVKLMVISIAVIRCMLFCEWLENEDISLEQCINIVKNYSEEIEYSEENLELLADVSYELDAFSVENLLGLWENGTVPFS